MTPFSGDVQAESSGQRLRRARGALSGLDVDAQEQEAAHGEEDDHRQEPARLEPVK